MRNSARMQCPTCVSEANFWVIPAAAKPSAVLPVV